MTLKNAEYPGKNAMPFSISFTSMEFLRLVDDRLQGNKPGNRWGVFDHVTCDHCYYKWVAISMFNTKGKHCPQCGYSDPDWIWMEYSEYKGEGAFLNPVGKDYSLVTKN